MKVTQIDMPGNGHEIRIEDVNRPNEYCWVKITKEGEATIALHAGRSAEIGHVMGYWSEKDIGFAFALARRTVELLKVNGL